MASLTTRTEHDLLGEKAVPAEAYYGVQTARALENFHISGVELRLYPNLIKALAMVKLAAARANFECGQFGKDVLVGIEKACQEIIEGKFHDEFRLDVFQGGAGTSTNMNANEVIANRALEHMGHKKGEYGYCSPTTTSTARSRRTMPIPRRCTSGWPWQRGARPVHERAHYGPPRQGARVLERPQDGPHPAAGRGADDAGARVRGLRRNSGGRGAGARGDPARALRDQHGATAIGTGLNAPEGYSQKCTDHLAKITGFPIHLADNLIEATQDTQAFVLYSSCMKSLAIKLSKVCNDLRLLSSGPRCGLREINLPPKQRDLRSCRGRSIGHPRGGQHGLLQDHRSDLTVSMAAEGGQLQLNVFEPVIAACIFEAQTMFVNAARTLRIHCIEGITANSEVTNHYVEYSIGTVTALNPVIGYERATELATEAMKTGRGILELLREKKILTEKQIREILDPAAMTGKGRPT